MLEIIHDIPRIAIRLSAWARRLPGLLLALLGLLTLGGFASMWSRPPDLTSPPCVDQATVVPTAGRRLLRLDAAWRPVRRADGSLALILDDTLCRLPDRTDLGGAALTVVNRGTATAPTRLLLTCESYWTAQPVNEGVLLTPHYPAVGPETDVTLTQVRSQAGDWVLDGASPAYAWHESGDKLVVDLIHCVPVNSLPVPAPASMQVLTDSPYAVTRLTWPVTGAFSLSAGPPWTLRLGDVSPFPPRGFESGVPIIVLDPGHGGEDPGTIAANGLEEKNVTLTVARKLQAALQAQGWRVLMTRNCDEELRPDAKDAEELGARVALADAPQVAAFVSLHCDASSCESAVGTTVHWNKPMDRSLADALGRDLHLPPADVDRSPFYVLRHAPVPSVLIELGYLSNPGEADRLSQDGYCSQLAADLSASLSRWVRAGGAHSTR